MIEFAFLYIFSCSIHSFYVIVCYVLSFGSPYLRVICLLHVEKLYIIIQFIDMSLNLCLNLFGKLKKCIEKKETAPTAAANEDESSASEYEEIIEEVTDTDSEEEEEDIEQETKEETKNAVKVESKIVEKKPVESKEEQKLLQESKAESVKETKDENVLAKAVEPNLSAASEKGESLIPLLQDLLHSNMLQAKSATQTKTITNSNVNKNNKTHTKPNKESNRTNNKMTNKKTKEQVTNATVTKRCTTDNVEKHSNQVKRLSVPHKEDSGTESGEDLRLIAAGLRNQLGMHGDSNLIAEVTTALSRLESSLRVGKDIAVDDAKRKALLALVERLQTGLTSPHKLAELATAMADIDSQEFNTNGNLSPEQDGQRNGKQRFGKRRNRNSRHTVGVSREELADARRYMEDMIMLENISNCTTPDSAMAATQWFPSDKNDSAVVFQTQPSSQLCRSNQFVSNNVKTSVDNLKVEDSKIIASKNNNRRPLSGDYSVCFEVPNDYEHRNGVVSDYEQQKHLQTDSTNKNTRFTPKRQLMKRANTIDLSKKFHSDFDTDSDMEDRSAPAWGLKRGVQVSVKKKVRNVIPPFEPKTENDLKFLAFINKQSPKSGLAWSGSKSVSNWSNKFGNIKNNFEVGIAATVTTGKPPQVPGHSHQNAAKNYWTRQMLQCTDNQRMVDMRLHKSQQDAIERQCRLENERLERQRIEADRLERQRQERERNRLEQQLFDRERLERENYEREKYERELFERQRFDRERYEQERAQLELARLERARLEQERLERARIEPERLERARIEQERLAMSIPAPVNQFIHAPQSVFRPIENDVQSKSSMYKTTHQVPRKLSNGQPTTLAKNDKLSASTPYLSSPSPSATSPIGLPWLSRPTVDNSDFRHKASMFEERSQHDNRPTLDGRQVQRHHSLKAPRLIQQVEIPKKRPSLTDAQEPLLTLRNTYEQDPYIRSGPPPPTNVSFTYADYAPRNDYKSMPCLLTAVNSTPSAYERMREDSLTNPAAMPLVLTTSNPLYQPQMTQNGSYNGYNSPLNSGSASPGISISQSNNYTDDDLDSNMTEYRVESKVMAKPKSQTAVTTNRRTTHMSDDEVFGKNSRAAKSLLHTMRNMDSNKRQNPPQTCLSPDGRSYQAPQVEPIFPQITNFEPNRKPIYVKSDQSSNDVYDRIKSPNQIKQNVRPPTYGNYEKSNHIIDQTLINYNATPISNNVMNTAPNFEPKHQKPMPQTYAARSNVSATQYKTEAQNSYIVSYPSEESINSLVQDTKIQQPNRQISENSTITSSHSNNQNVQNSNMTWTYNPIAKTDTPKDIVSKPVETIKTATVKETEKAVKLEQKPKQTARPNVAPKPQVVSQSNNATTSTVSQKSKEHIKSTVNDKVVANAQNRLVTQTNAELRRKSLTSGQSKSLHIETQKEIKEIYKSSAPPDTPDIVKSSLPKDETMPILKKFGPPQRHHYVPNAYQNPLAKTTTIKTQKFVSAKQIVHQSSLPNKPTIRETPSTPQPDDEYIPRNIVFNNISAFTSLSRKEETPLSKSDSWNLLIQQQNKPPTVNVAKYNGSMHELRRSKSGHTLTVPKMYEAGLDKAEISEKQKTVAAYFSGSKSPNSQLEQNITETKRTAINRIKTSEKLTASRKSLTTSSSNATTTSSIGLSRSATMPHIANINLLDESNVEDAFEQLMSGA